VGEAESQRDAYLQMRALDHPQARLRHPSKRSAIKCRNGSSQRGRTKLPKYWKQERIRQGMTRREGGLRGLVKALKTSRVAEGRKKNIP